jgi:hypothetical protein
VVFPDRVPITGTFKHQKVQLRKEVCDGCRALLRVRCVHICLMVVQGADPATVPDPVFYLNPDSRVYEPLDVPAYARLCTPGSRL